MGYFFYMKIKRITMTAMFAALICILTYFIKIPTLNGYINIGDTLILLIGVLLPPVYSFFASAIGSSLADIFSGYMIYAPITFLIKGSISVISYFIYNALKKKGIVGKAFECTEYAVAQNPRFGRVFSLEMVSIDKKVIDRLIIIEESPRHFKISFDGYVGTERQNVEVTREGLKLNILNAEEYKDRVHFKMKITNVSEDIIVMNSQNRASEPVYVLLSNDKKIYNSDDIFVTKSITLKPGESFEAEMTFYTVDLQAARIKKLYIIDVYNETSKSTTTFEYDIY